MEGAPRIESGLIRHALVFVVAERAGMDRNGGTLGRGRQRGIFPELVDLHQLAVILPQDFGQFVGEVVGYVFVDDQDRRRRDGRNIFHEPLIGSLFYGRFDEPRILFDVGTGDLIGDRQEPDAGTEIEGNERRIRRRR